MKKIYFFVISLLFLGAIFFASYNRQILLAPGDSRSTLISIQAPSVMQAGQPYQIKVTYRNDGITTWTEEQGFRLGNPDFGNPLTFGPGRIFLESTDSISPGEEKTFTYWLSAPQDAGNYYLSLRMVHEHVEWFGDQTPQTPIIVEDHRLMNTGNAIPEPALAWISRSSNGIGAWLIDRPDNALNGDEGLPCPSGLGWQNTYIVSSQVNFDGTIGRKKITGSNCLGGSPSNLIPWGDVPDLHKYFPNQFQQGSTIIPPHWSIVKSNGLRISNLTGQFLEEFHPEPGLIILPTDIIPDGQEHITQKCYINPIYFNEQGSGEICYDAICSAGSGICPGSNTMINTKYRVYEYCFGDFCYANGQTISVPVNFGERLESVLRVSYTLASGTCTGPPVLTEEQWYAEGVGLVGFSNNDPLSPAPNSVDFQGVYKANQCLPYWDNFCKTGDYNYNQCCPPGHAQCNVYRQDMILPTINFTSLSQGQSIQGIKNIIADANDNVGVQKVEFYIDNYIQFTDNVSPYSYDLNTTELTNGVHKITARAYDTSENYITTPIIFANVSNGNQTNGSQICGDNLCNGAETCSTCSSDCGACSSGTTSGSSGGSGGGGGGSGGIRPPSGTTGSSGTGTTSGGSSGGLPGQSTQIQNEEPSVLETSEKKYELKIIYWSAFTILIASIIFALVKIGKLVKIRINNSSDLAFKELALRSQRLDGAFNNKN